MYWCFLYKFYNQCAKKNFTGWILLPGTLRNLFWIYSSITLKTLHECLDLTLVVAKITYALGLSLIWTFLLLLGLFVLCSSNSREPSKSSSEFWKSVAEKCQYFCISSNSTYTYTHSIHIHIYLSIYLSIYIYIYIYLYI